MSQNNIEEHPVNPSHFLDYTNIVFVLALLVSFIFCVIPFPIGKWHGIISKEQYLIDNTAISPLMIFMSQVPAKAKLLIILDFADFLARSFLLPIVFLFAWLSLKNTFKKEKKKFSLIPIEKKEIEAFKILNDIISEKLKNKISIKWSDSKAMSIRVFSDLDQYYLEITSGFWKKFKNKKNELEAILCHEIAHILNGDVIKVQWIHSLFRSLTISYLFMLFITISYGVVFDVVLGNEKEIIKALLAQFLGKNYYLNMMLISIIMIILANQSILKIREYEADALAVFLMGEEKSLKSALTRWDTINSQGKALKRI